MGTTREDIQMVLSAEDKATGTLRKTQESMKDFGRSVKDTGEKTKRSTELVGVFASTLGGTQFGSAAGEVALMTERIAQFSDVAAKSKLAAIALKGALVAGVGVAAFKVGQMLGDLIFQTKRYGEQLDRLTQKETELANQQMRRQSQRFADSQEIIGLLDGKEKELEIAKQLQMVENEIRGKQMQFRAAEAQFSQTERENKAWIKTASDQELEAAKNRRDLTKAELEQLKEQQRTLERMTGEHAEQVAMLQQRNADRAFVESLQQQLDTMGKTKTEILRIQAGENEAALAIIRQIEHQEKLNEKKQRQKQIEQELAQERKRINGLIDNSVDGLQLQLEEMVNGKKAAEQLRLQMQGVDEETAARIASLKETIEDIKGGDGASLGGGPGQVGTQANTSRLTSGRNRGLDLQRKIATESEETKKINTQQLNIAKQMLTELQALTARDNGTEVVG